MLVLWPTRHSGARLLRNWGITEPTGPQTVARLAWPPVDDNETPGDI